jgi:DNA polymerase III subunit delta'
VPSLLDYTALWEGVQHSFAQQRMAHAYIIAGPPRGAAGMFAEAMIKLVLGVNEQAVRRLDAKSHPDVFWIEPESKSRMITVEKMRALNARMGQTSMEGGWKVGVIAFADRLNEQSSNAFLKTLEEPAGQTLLLLLTDEPHQMLPTIRSRCQLIQLHAGKEAPKEEWRTILIALLREQHMRDIMHGLAFADQIRGLLDLIKKSFSDEEGAEITEEAENDPAGKKEVEARIQSRLLEVRQQILTDIAWWYRDVLIVKYGLEQEALHFPEEYDALARQAGEASISALLRRIDGVETMHARLKGNIPAATVLDAASLSSFVRR